jgi:hypothetical protein
MLGYDQPVILHLIDIPQAQKALTGVAMELGDCAFPLLHGIVCTDDLKVGKISIIQDSLMLKLLFWLVLNLEVKVCKEAISYKKMRKSLFLKAELLMIMPIEMLEL